MSTLPMLKTIFRNSCNETKVIERTRIVALLPTFPNLFCINLIFKTVLITNQVQNFFPLGRCGPTRAMTSSFLWFLDHTQRRITVGRNPLDA